MNNPGNILKENALVSNTHIRHLVPESSSLDIRIDTIIKSLSVPADAADEYLVEKIQSLILQCKSICSTSGCYGFYNNPSFTREAGVMHLEGFTFHLNKTVTSALLKSSGIVIFIGTCGWEVEQYAKQLMKEGHFLEGLIVDLIGSEIAESVTALIHDEVVREMSDLGLKTTNRYSPGYCGWPVSDQKNLFSILSENPCNVTLTDSCLMLPIKSVSGIIGVGANVKNRGYSCSVCETENCLYRDKNMC